jgi:hypothetical protein
MAPPWLSSIFALRCASVDSLSVRAKKTPRNMPPHKRHHLKQNVRDCSLVYLCLCICFRANKITALATSSLQPLRNGYPHPYQENGSSQRLLMPKARVPADAMWASPPPPPPPSFSMIAPACPPLHPPSRSNVARCKMIPQHHRNNTRTMRTMRMTRTRTRRRRRRRRTRMVQAYATKLEAGATCNNRSNVSCTGQNDRIRRPNFESCISSWHPHPPSIDKNVIPNSTSNNRTRRASSAPLPPLP